jgi:hypothetical protein
LKPVSPIFLLLATLLSGGVAFAQLNESDTARFQLKAGLNGLRQTGNVELGIVRSRLECVIRLGSSFTYKTQNNSLYQEFASRRADNDLNSRNYLYFKPNLKIYPFGMAYWQRNYRLKIDSRFFTGAGATLQLLRQEHQSLKFSLSLVYEETLYASNFFNSPIYNTSSIRIWRPTLYTAGTHGWSDGKIRLHYTVYWQPGLDFASNQRMQGEVGLDFIIWKSLSVSFQYWRIFEEIVPKEVKQSDGIFTVGMNYQIKMEKKS